MKTIKKQFQRILSIYPTSKGFGYIVMERGNELIDWGTKRVRLKKSQKNKECVRKSAILMEMYQPDAVILPEPGDLRRCQRIRNLINQIANRATAKGIVVVTVTRKQIKRRFAPHGASTKYEIIKLIAEWYPPVRAMLPGPWKPWESEDGRIGLFCSLAQYRS